MNQVSVETPDCQRGLGSTQDHLLHRDGARQTRCIARLRRKLRRACRCERVDNCWLAILVTLACTSFCTPPSCVPSTGTAFTVLGHPYRLCHCLVVRCLRCLPSLTDVHVHNIDLHCCRVCPRSAHPAVVDDLVTRRLVRCQSADTQTDALFQTLVCHASTNNSVLDCIADEITGLLLTLGDVTLE